MRAERDMGDPCHIFFPSIGPIPAGGSTIGNVYFWPQKERLSENLKILSRRDIYRRNNGNYKLA